MGWSTADGKEYRMVVCWCGRQDTSGRCSHVRDPLIVYTSANCPEPAYPYVWPNISRLVYDGKTGIHFWDIE